MHVLILSPLVVFTVCSVILSSFPIFKPNYVCITSTVIFIVKSIFLRPNSIIILSCPAFTTIGAFSPFIIFKYSFFYRFVFLLLRWFISIRIIFWFLLLIDPFFFTKRLYFNRFNRWGLWRKGAVRYLCCN